jgi:hypothetical protein
MSIQLDIEITWGKHSIKRCTHVVQLSEKLLVYSFGKLRSKVWLKNKTHSKYENVHDYISGRIPHFIVLKSKIAYTISHLFA